MDMLSKIKKKIESLEFTAANIQTWIDLVPEKETLALAQLDYVKRKIESLREAEIWAMPGSKLFKAGDHQEIFKKTPGSEYGRGPTLQEQADAYLAAERSKDPSFTATLKDGEFHFQEDFPDSPDSKHTPLPHNYKASDLHRVGECDPDGVGAHEPGAKLDAGKQMAGLFHQDFCRAIKAVVEVVTFGAKKYSVSGWLGVPDANLRYKNALHRHLNQMELDDNDPDSGYLHLAHAAWNVLALLELKLREKDKGVKWHGKREVVIPPVDIPFKKWEDPS